MRFYKRSYRMYLGVIAGLLCFQVGAAYAAQSISYHVSFENAIHHEARISVTFKGVMRETLELRMSRSSPGRYALHEFGKNIYQVSAVDGKGSALELVRPDAYQWDVKHHDGTVTVKYTLYADRIDGTYSGIDGTHAHLNMPATFMWARGFEQAPIDIKFKPLDKKWKVATQLVKTKKSFEFTAPNLQYFMDSPTELSDFSMRQWPVKSNGKKYTLEMAIHHDGTESDVDTFAKLSKGVVAEHIKVYGELPDFDYGRYIFIADFLEHADGDGMEHRNSTVVTEGKSLDDSKFAQLGTISHEFFHAWNVERIRPKSLEPFDFEKANVSSELWFAEGFTTYYGNLLVRRADAETVTQYLKRVSESLSEFINAPGRQYFSAAGMSRLALFKDSATSIDPMNFDNMFISYYTYGAAIALALDLTLRSEFEGISLDTYMRQVWSDYGKNEQHYTNSDLQMSLAKITNERFAKTFFDQYVFGQALPDYKSLLAKAGILLDDKYKGCPSVGSVAMKFEGSEAVIVGATIIGSPLYNAGLDRGDHIIKFDRRKIKNQQDWRRVLNRYQPGDTAKIQYMQRGQMLTADIVFEKDSALKATTYRSAGLHETPAMLAFRKRWLGEEKYQKAQIGHHSRRHEGSNSNCGREG